MCSVRATLSLKQSSSKHCIPCKSYYKASEAEKASILLAFRQASEIFGGDKQGADKLSLDFLTKYHNKSTPLVPRLDAVNLNGPLQTELGRTEDLVSKKLLNTVLSAFDAVYSAALCGKYNEKQNKKIAVLHAIMDGIRQTNIQREKLVEFGFKAVSSHKALSNAGKRAKQTSVPNDTKEHSSSRCKSMKLYKLILACS